MPAPSTPAPSGSRATARAGFVVAVVVNVMMLIAVNVWPGWQAVPFLTADMQQVVGLVNLSLLAGIGANLVFLASPAPWLRPLGDLVTTLVGLVAVVRLVEVFPFAFGDTALDWAAIARVVLIVAIVGTAIAALVQTAALVREVAGGSRPARPGH